MAGITVATFSFGVVYGLAARQAGFSFLETMAMSLIVLAGASQFAAVGFVAQGLSWLAIVPLTALLNARHLFYSAALAPWLQRRPRLERAVMAHILTDETFAISLAHFRRLGQADVAGYWIAAFFIVVPWPAATAVGFLGGEAIPDPRVLGLDVAFPVTMAGLAVSVISGRRELVAALVGALVAVGVGLATSIAVGFVAGGLVGPVVGLLVPHPAGDAPDDRPPSTTGHDETIGVAM